MAARQAQLAMRIPEAMDWPGEPGYWRNSDAARGRIRPHRMRGGFIGGGDDKVLTVL
jgi:hypothetical protein